MQTKNVDHINFIVYSGIQQLTNRKDVMQKLQKYDKVVVISGVKK